jgi:hypothetical protein
MPRSFRPRTFAPPNFDPVSTSTSETSGGLLPDGKIADLIIDEVTGRLKLVCFDGTRYLTGHHIETKAGTLVPPAIDPVVLRATVMPTKVSPYGSIIEFYASIQDLFKEFGFAECVATAAALCIFPTWFSDPSLPMLSVVVTGPAPEAMLLLQLLGCMVRRPLRMFELGNYGSLGSIRQLHPTISLDGRRFKPLALHKLFSSSTPRTFVPWKGSLVECAFSKIIYLGSDTTPEVLGDFSMQIHVTPSRRVFPNLSEKRRNEITATFQPKFLDYHCRNLARISASDFDLPSSESELRILARLLGRCFPDAPEVQADVKALVENWESDFQASRWSDPICALIETVLDASHSPKADAIFVAEIAERASTILKARGASDKLKARSVGSKLRKLGFIPKRNGAGYRLFLNEETSRKAHQRAREYRVPAVEEGISVCSICSEDHPDIH